MRLVLVPSCGPPFPHSWPYQWISIIWQDIKPLFVRIVLRQFLYFNVLLLWRLRWAEITTVTESNGALKARRIRYLHHFQMEVIIRFSGQDPGENLIKIACFKAPMFAEFWKPCLDESFKFLVQAVALRTQHSSRYRVDSTGVCATQPNATQHTHTMCLCRTPSELVSSTRNWTASAAYGSVCPARRGCQHAESCDECWCDGAN